MSRLLIPNAKHVSKGHQFDACARACDGLGSSRMVADRFPGSDRSHFCEGYWANLVLVNLH
ncbi:MAG: hypothetical protein P8014_19950 [Acidihalobacter sp.]|uniref:hypothetical protein n=1 Tax=Acidihalobacter sp. TaxID=1872108 RepID=UPI00307EDC32